MRELYDTDIFAGFYDRILEIGERDQKTLEQAALKLCEEAGEVAAEVLRSVGASGVGYKGKASDAEIVEEVCDVIIVATAILGILRERHEHSNFDPLTRGMLHSKLGKWSQVLEEDHDE